MGMGFLLAHCFCNGVQHLRVCGDSKIAIEFMKGNFQARLQHLVTLVEANKQLASHFKSVRFEHVMREINFEADQLAADALGPSPRKNREK
jgi:ribonuclease HI